MKKILTSLTAIAAFTLITPSIINNTHFVVQELKGISKFVLNKISVPGMTSFGSFRSNTYKDKQGNVWVSSENGLYKYDPITKIFSQVLGGLPSGSSEKINFLTQDSAGNYWVAVWTNSEGYNIFTCSLWFSTDGMNFQQAQFTPNGATKYIFCYKQSNGKLWFLTSKGLFWIQNSTSAFNQVKNGLPTDFAPLAIFINSTTGYLYTCDRYHVYSAADDNNFAINKGIGLPADMGYTGPDTLADDINYLPHFYQDSLGNVYFTVNYQIYKCTDGVNPLFLTNMQLINISLFTSDPWISSFFIDSKNNIWVGTKAKDSLNGSIFMSSNGGVSFTSEYASAGVGTYFYQDKLGIVWCLTTLGIYFANSDNTSLSIIQSGYFLNMRQDESGQIWIIGFNDLYTCISETFSGTGYSTAGNKIDRRYNGIHYTFANKDILFYANDTFVTTVQIDGQTFTVNGAGFTRTLTSATNNGMFNIIVTYSDGTIATYHFWIFSATKDNIANLSSSSTMQIYTASLKGKDVNYFFCKSSSAGTNANFEIKLGLTGYDPIVDLTNSYYEQVNPTTFDVIPGTKTALTSDTNINTNGFYLITITDYLGVSFQYYVQLGDANAKQILGPVNPLLPITPAKPKVEWMNLIPSTKIIPWMDNTTPANKIKIPWMNLTKSDKVPVSWKILTPSTRIQPWNSLNAAVKKIQPSKPAIRSMSIAPSNPYTPPSHQVSSDHIYDNKLFIGIISAIVGLGAGSLVIGTTLTILHFAKKHK